MKIVSDYYDCIDYLQDYSDPRTFVRRCEVFGTYTREARILHKASDYISCGTLYSEATWTLMNWFRELCRGYYWHRGTHYFSKAESLPIPEDLNSKLVFVSMFDESLTSTLSVRVREGCHIWSDERPSWSDFSFEFVDNANTCLNWVKDWADSMNSKVSDNPNVQEKITHFITFGKYEDTEVIINPPLKKFPWIFEERKHEEIFQDIEQFLWKDVDLSEQKPVTDKVKVESHGFDSKKSFRKEKGK